MTAYERLARLAESGHFEETLARCADLVEAMESTRTGGLTHDALEDVIEGRLRTIGHGAIADHLALRALREQPVSPRPVGADEIPRTRLEHGHDTVLTSLFGDVTVVRKAYRAPGVRNLYPADRDLNLPDGQYSHGLRRRIVRAVAISPYDEAIDAVERDTGVRVGKRQAVQAVERAAMDLEAFYALPPDERLPPDDRDATATTIMGEEDRALGEGADQQQADGDAPERGLLVLQADGKGIPMRPDGLRAQAAKAAAEAKATDRRRTGLASAEKTGRTRMAEVTTVYRIARAPRTIDDVVPAPGRRDTAEAAAARAAKRRAAPRPVDRWLSASLVDDIPTAIATMFDQAELRDHGRELDWVALVDGNNAQIAAIEAEATRRDLTLTVIVDVIHVIGYLWKAAAVFFTCDDPDDPGGKNWLRDRLRALLAGRARDVATGIRRRATGEALTGTGRQTIDEVARYLDAKAPYLDYPTALAEGYPIATGVMEGACRHLVMDRFEVGGARWGLEGAEAVLGLRAVITNGDFDAYWRFHLRQELRRNHDSKYAEPHTPT
ncbi:ISKra4 family transposase [Frankia sp. CiP3]|uniref:ISKra4 family transposase n=1 Tax=Frankia sp. CiP3 TaxID=2880971 RepID=UPI001EF68FCF|nr:ISKra4 family transposase [Frankia sp. CiP3]